MKMALYLCGIPPKTHNPSLIMGKTLEKYQLRDILQNHQKQSLRNSHSQEVPKETWQLNGILDGILGQKKGIR